MAAENIQNRVNDKFPNLESVVARTMWPTPTASDYRGSGPTVVRKDGKNRLNDRLDYATEQRAQNGGQLNPTWVEWLMGFPTGWTDLKASEMPSSRKSSRKSAKQS
jgi:DNA (cytosine-5)-methyltransferase 1